MRLNYEPFLFDPKEIDFVLLTHAHIDHCGILPKLHRDGFDGKIYTTSATRDLCEILFEDSAEIIYIAVPAHVANLFDAQIRVR